jgi:hypothetical protein
MDRKLCVLCYSQYSPACQALLRFISKLPLDLPTITGMTMLNVDSETVRSIILDHKITTVPVLLIEYFVNSEFPEFNYKQMLKGEQIYEWIKEIQSKFFWESKSLSNLTNASYLGGSDTKDTATAEGGSRGAATPRREAPSTFGDTAFDGSTRREAPGGTSFGGKRQVTFLNQHQPSPRMGLTPPTFGDPSHYNTDIDLNTSQNEKESYNMEEPNLDISTPVKSSGSDNHKERQTTASIAMEMERQRAVEDKRLTDRLKQQQFGN